MNTGALYLASHVSRDAIRLLGDICERYCPRYAASQLPPSTIRMILPPAAFARSNSAANLRRSRQKLLAISPNPILRSTAMIPARLMIFPEASVNSAE